MTGEDGVFSYVADDSGELPTFTASLYDEEGTSVGAYTWNMIVPKDAPTWTQDLAPKLASNTSRYEFGYNGADPITSNESVTVQIKAKDDNGDMLASATLSIGSNRNSM